MMVKNERFSIEHKDNNERTFLDAAPKVFASYIAAITNIHDNLQLGLALQKIDLTHISDAQKLRALYESRDYKTIISKTKTSISEVESLIENFELTDELENKDLIKNLLKFLNQFLELVIDMEKQGELDFQTGIKIKS